MTMNSKFETYLLDQEGTEVVEGTVEYAAELTEQELPEGFWTEL